MSILKKYLSYLPFILFTFFISSFSYADLFEDFLAKDVMNHPKEIHCEQDPKYSDCYGEYLFEKTSQNYQGNFKNGLPHGKGLMEYLDKGIMIFGVWNKGQVPEDAIVYSAKSDKTYRGKFKNNKKIGKFQFLNEGEPQISLAEFSKMTAKSVANNKKNNNYNLIVNQLYTGKIISEDYIGPVVVTFKIKNGKLIGTQKMFSSSKKEFTSEIKKIILNDKSLTGIIETSSGGNFNLKLTFSKDFKSFNGTKNNIKSNYKSQITGNIMSKKKSDELIVKMLKPIKALSNVVSVYENYIRISSYCEDNKSSGHFKEFKKDVKIILDKLISEAEIPNDKISSFKDKAYDRAQATLDRDSEFQSQLITMTALDKSQSYQICKKTTAGIAPMYRMMAKQAKKSNTKKKRDL